MAILDLFIAATMPVLKVLLVTGVGSILAARPLNILNDEARKHLNNIVFYVFNPALVLANLAQTITFKSMILLWFMPLNILFTVIIGSAFGWIVTKITKPPSHLKGLIIGCCAGGNLGTMPLIIVPAICKEKGSPFGAPDLCSTYGLAYVSLSMAIGAIFLWSYIFNIVRVSSEQRTEIQNSTRREEFSEESKILISDTDAQNSTIECYAPSSSSVGNIDKLKLSAFDKFRRIVEMFSGKIHWKKLFAPSTIAVIIGFIVGVISPIRKSLIGGDAPLRAIQDSIALLGDGAIPSLTLILGGNLVKGMRESEIRRSFIIGVVVVRYLLLPLFGVTIVRGAYHLGLLHSDPLYQFVLLVQFAVPPAINIGTITQLFGAGESECSVILLWTYALSSILVTLWSTFFMWLVVSISQKSNFILASVPSNLRTVPHAASTTPGQSDESDRLNLDEVFEITGSLSVKLPELVTSFPWPDVVYKLVCAVCKYVCVPLLAITSLCELVYCACQEIMAITSVPLLLGWFVAGSINKTILETSTTAKEREVPWHLLGMALFFLLLKFRCPCQCRGVCLLISLFATAGLWRMLWFSFWWTRSIRQQRVGEGDLGREN